MTQNASMFIFSRLRWHLLTHSLTHSLPASLESAHLWRRSTDTPHRKQISRDAMQHCVRWQHMRYLCGQKENTASPIVVRAYFGRGPEVTSFCCCVLEHVYGAVAWQWVFALQYIEFFSGLGRVIRWIFISMNNVLNEGRKFKYSLCPTLFFIRLTVF
jgi:hypothetical protein